MRAVRIIPAIALAVLLLAGALPAFAGTAATPEITDSCGAQVQQSDDQTTFTPGHVDICSGWFKTTASGLKVTLQTSQDIDAPEASGGGFWAVWWRHGDCVYEVKVDDAVSAASPQTFSAGCGEAPPLKCGPLGLQCEDSGYWRNFDLPPSSVVRDGDKLAVSVDFTGALSEFAAAHKPGEVLRAPHAFASATFGPVYAFSMGCSFSDFLEHCYSANGDLTAEGRDYTVGT